MLFGPEYYCMSEWRYSNKAEILGGKEEYMEEWAHLCGAIISSF